MEAHLTRKCLVVSAVNFSEGGPLTILRDCLSSAAHNLPSEWEIIALIHDKRLINEPRVRLVEVKDAKRSWFLRIYYEWFGFRELSKQFVPDLWLSLHDVTPRVLSRRQAVYCHNPSPFYRLSLHEIWLEPRFWLFNLFYRYLYQAFIRRNYWVIVQQAWLRDEFFSMFGPLPIVVAHPSVRLQAGNHQSKLSGQGIIFFYPAFPRMFKNFELICEAAKILNMRGVVGFEVRLTLKGDENRYSKWLYAKYSAVSKLSFMGLQNREQMSDQYAAATAVIFPSKLETWGLPISEAKSYGKPLLVVDFPYAHEAVGTYDKVSFFDPTNAEALADLMQDIINKCWLPMGAKVDKPEQPFTQNWNELWQLLTKDL
jgi:glycosyltransferase involved in cell wall biosynthesis